MVRCNEFHQLFLASRSPRRHELLGILGLKFQVGWVDVNESGYSSETPEDLALRLARDKATAVCCDVQEGTIVIAADTIVSDDNHSLGKPENADDAKTMLRKLRGRSHEAITAIAVMRACDTEVYADICTTEVYLRDFSDDELDSYVASGDPLDKAGAYGIQNKHFRLAAPVGGCLANVIGLPLCHIARTLRRLNIEIPVNVSDVCQLHLEYDCPVHESILSA